MNENAMLIGSKSKNKLFVIEGKFYRIEGQGQPIDQGTSYACSKFRLVEVGLEESSKVLWPELHDKGTV